MESESKFVLKNEIKVILALTFSSALMAFNLKSFVQTGGLYPGGFSGLTILLQGIIEMISGVMVPYSALYIPLNLIPAFIGFKFISKKFTIYSFYVVFLTSILTDIIPSVTITYDTLLIAIFGGILGSVSISISLISGASAGGTDFISIWLSEKKGIDAWNYILMANVVILGTAGILFGFDKALYSIIYQYASTQVIQMLFKRYQKDTLFIITDLPEAVYGRIRDITHHDATLIEATGCYQGADRSILYSVVGREQVDKVISSIKEIDPKAFINVINSDQISGRFYKKPY